MNSFVRFIWIILPWGQRSRSHKVITVRDTPPCGHAPTYQLSLTYLERQKCYGPDKKILFKKQLFDLRSKVKVPQRSLWYVTQPYGHAPTYEISLTYLERQKSYGPDKLRWEEAEENQTKTICLPSFEGETYKL
jgi:hypothetical protein